MSNITLRKSATSKSSSNESDDGASAVDKVSELDGEVELRRSPSKLMFMASRRRSSMLADAKKNSVKCNLPCFDEEDDGIPPFCRHELCPLDHRNKYLNLGSQDGGYADCCVMFGNVGFPWFDRRRGFMMGIATISTVMAIFITTYGCLSLAKDDGIIKLTYWVRANAYNTTSFDKPPIKLAHEDAFEVYIGLTSMVQRECVSGTGCFESESHVIEWWKSKDLGQDVNGMDLCRDASKLDHFCDQCRDVAVNSITAAFFACATLLFALYGCINRMKFVSDCPVQKLLGCITDSWGALSLTYALYQFQNKCFWHLPSNIDGYEISYVRGPGIYMYLFCALSGYIRAILHWLTPLPGQGIGCRMQLPTRDRAKETLAAITKWQQDTRQQLEVQFVNVNSQLGQGLNTAIQTSTSGLKTAKDVTVKTTSHLLRSSISIASSATEVVRRPSWASPADINKTSPPVKEVVSALEGDEAGDSLNDWESFKEKSVSRISKTEESLEVLRARAIDVTEQHGANSSESKKAWKEVFASQHAQDSPPPPPPPNDNVWWSPAGLKKHLGGKYSGDGGPVSVQSLRGQLSKLDIGAPTNVHHVVSATVNTMDHETQVNQPGGKSFTGNRVLTSRKSRVSGEDLDIEAGEGALHRLSVGLVNRRASDTAGNIHMEEVYDMMGRRSSSFTGKNRRSLGDASLDLHNASMPQISLMHVKSPEVPHPPPPSPVSPTSNSQPPSLAKNLFGPPPAASTERAAEKMVAPETEEGNKLANRKLEQPKNKVATQEQRTSSNSSSRGKGTSRSKEKEKSSIKSINVEKKSLTQSSKAKKSSPKSALAYSTPL